MKINPATLGGFVLGGLLLAAGAVMFFGGMRLFTPTLRAVVFFPTSVAGLSVGSPVTFRGVQVGSVRKISLLLNVEDRSSVIPVIVELDGDHISWDGTGVMEADKDVEPGIPRLVKAGLRATLGTPSLVTGQLGMDLDFEPGAAPSLPGPDIGLPEIPSVPSVFQNLKNRLSDLPLSDLVNDLRTTLVSVRTLSSSLGDKLGPLVESAQQTASAARETLLASTDAVHQLSTDTTRTLGHIDQLTIDGRQQVVLAGRDLQRVLGSAQRAAQSAESLMASLNSIAAPRSEMRGDLQASLRDLAASASSLRRFTRDLERSPISALKGQ